MAPRFVIVGSGAAGVAAAEAARQRDGSASITLVTADRHGYYSRPGLPYYLEGLIPERQLHPRFEAGLELELLQARAALVSPNEHVVVLEDGRRLPYDRLLLATGSSAMPLDFPGGDLDGVVRLDNLDDARRILRLSRRGRTAIVVGGGITAVELVQGLRARGMKVHYCLRGDRYWTNVLDETESRIVERWLAGEGVVLHHRTVIREAAGDRGRLVAVVTEDGRRLPCDILAVAIGVRPESGLARRAGLACQRGVLADQYLESSMADIYAAGDVAQVYDPRSGLSVLDVLWSSAVEQGRAAGANMAGDHVPYRRSVALNVTRLAGLMVTVIGSLGGGNDADVRTISRGDSEAWRAHADAWIVEQAHESNRVRLLIGERAVVGALLMGDQSLSLPLQWLVGGEIDIRSIARALREPEAPITAILQDFYRQNRY